MDAPLVLRSAKMAFKNEAGMLWFSWTLTGDALVAGGVGWWSLCLWVARVVGARECQAHPGEPHAGGVTDPGRRREDAMSHDTCRLVWRPCKY